jgi:hypothetical protein
MKKCIFDLLAIFAFLTLAGCGSDAPPAPAFVDAQKNLPEGGNWLCRLDYTIHYRDGSSDQSFFGVDGEGRDTVKQKIAEQCIRSPYEMDCREALTADHFLCARGDNTGHLDTFPNVTYCRLPFSVTFRDGTRTQRLYESTGPDQRTAVKKLFATCLHGFTPRECTDAIFADATECRPIQ